MTALVRVSWLFIACAVLAFIAGVCSTPEYKTFSFEHRTNPSAQDPVEQVTRFSFQYPRGYRRISTYAKPGSGPPIIIHFARATGTFGCVRQTDTVLGVNIGRGSAGFLNATEAATRATSSLGDQGIVRERSSVMVAGLTAQQVVYFDPRMPDNPEVRAVFFDYDGRIWEILIYSTTNRGDQAMRDFDRVVQTFKVLP